MFESRRDTKVITNPGIALSDKNQLRTRSAIGLANRHMHICHVSRYAAIRISIRRAEIPLDGAFDDPRPGFGRLPRCKRTAIDTKIGAHINIDSADAHAVSAGFHGRSDSNRVVWRRRCRRRF